MPIILPAGFNITSTEPADARFALANQAARLGLSTANVYKGLVVFQQDNNTLYVLIDATQPSLNASWQVIGTNITGSLLLSGSIVVTGSISATGGFTGSLQGTASWANNAISSSFASTSSFTPNAVVTASVSLNTITFTKGDGSTFPITVNTGSGGGGGTTFPFTGSAIISGSLQVTGSLGVSGSVFLPSLSLLTRPHAIAYDTASGQLYYVPTSSFGGGGGGSTPPGGNPTELQYNNGGVFGGVPLATYNGSTLNLTASLQGTSSWANNALTSSFITASNVFGPFGSNSILSSSYALTASFALNAGGGGSAFPFTGSAQITGSLGVTGSVSINATSNALTVLGGATIRGTGTTNSTKTLILQNSTPTDTVTVFDNGNIGIGTTSDAGFRVDISGSARISSSLSLGSTFPGTARIIIPLSASTGVGNFIVSTTALSSTANFGSSNIIISTDNSSYNSYNNASNNVLIGSSAGRTLSTATETTIIGRNAGSSITTGGRNTFLGAGAGVGISSGFGNTIIGATAGGTLPDFTGTIHILGGVGYFNSSTTGIPATRHVFIGGGDVNGRHLTDFYFGAMPFSSIGGPSTDITFYAPSATGSNIAGASFTIAAGRGTGTASAGDIVFSTSTTTTSGDNLQTLSSRVRIKGQTGNVIIGSTTGLDTGSFRLNVSGSGNFTNNLTVTGSLAINTGDSFLFSNTDNALTYNTSQNLYRRWTGTNTSTGTDAAVGFLFFNDTNDLFQFYHGSSNNSSVTPRSSMIRNNGPGGLRFTTDQGPIVFYAGSTSIERARFSNSGSLLINKTTDDLVNKLQVSGSSDFQGGVTISGSLTVFTGSGIEFQVTNTGTKIGNIITDIHNVTGSLGVSGSVFLPSLSLLTRPHAIAYDTASGQLYYVPTSSFGGGGGGSTPPGGNPNELQYNNGGVFGGVPLATYNGSTLNLTASLQGTASWANNVLTSSFITASNVFGPFGSNSILSSSYALTASFALNAGGAASAFPFTGSAQITGSLGVTGSVSINATSNALTVLGGAAIRGTGTTNSTKTLVLQNATPTDTVTFFDNGNVGFGVTTDGGFRTDISGSARITGSLTLGSNYSGSARIIIPLLNNRSSFIVTPSNFNPTANVKDDNLIISTAPSTYSSYNGVQNILLGSRPGESITTGYGNVVIGQAAGVNLTSGDRNVFIGYALGTGISTGYGNIIIGAGPGGAGFNLPNLSATIHLLAGAGYFNGSATGIPSSKHIFIGGGVDSSVIANDFYFGHMPFSTLGNGTGLLNITFYAPSATGSNLAGANFTIAAGRGTGTGSAGDLVLQTSTTASTGDNLQALSDRIRIKGNTGNVIIGSAAGLDTGSFRLNVSGSGHFLGSLVTSGSFTVVTGSGIEFQVTNTGVKIGDVITDAHTVTGSINVSGSITSSLFGTASWANNAITSSYILNAVSASFVTASNVFGPYGSNSIVSASYAVTSSIALTSLNASDILIYVKNSTGAQINKGTVVRIDGAVGDNPLISTASYADDNNSANTLGITNENIANDSFGYVMTEGKLLGIDTSMFTVGQLVFLGPTGSITGSNPHAPLHAVRLGQILRVQQNNGSMYVRIDNGYELGELHDVRDTTTTSSYGDLLVKSGSIWINSRQLTGSYELTGSLTATSFTGSLQGTASWANNAISASFASTSSFINTLNQNLIISGGLTVFTGSGIEFQVIDTGIKIGNVITDAHNITGSLNVSGSITGSLFGTSSFATTASFALNGGVTQIIAGTNVTISPTSGLGAVTINSTGGGGGGSTFPFTGSAIISGSLQVTGSVSSTEGFTGSLLGTASFANTASVALFAINMSNMAGSLTTTFDGLGSVVLINSFDYYRVPKAGMITGWSVIANGTWPTMSFDVWVTGSDGSIPTSANSICGGNFPFISGSRNAISSSNLTNWTTSFAADSVFAVNVRSSSVATKASLLLTVMYS